LFLLDHPSLEKVSENDLASITHTASIRIDASKAGWGAEITDITSGTHEQFVGKWDKKKSKKHSNVRELSAIADLLEQNTEKLANKCLLFKTDNKSVVHYINYGSGRIAELREIAERIVLICAAHGIEIFADHIEGESNVLADILSRALPHNPIVTELVPFKESFFRCHISEGNNWRILNRHYNQIPDLFEQEAFVENINYIIFIDIASTKLTLGYLKKYKNTIPFIIVFLTQKGCYYVTQQLQSSKFQKQANNVAAAISHTYKLVEIWSNISRERLLTIVQPPHN